jgi:hypothetical protein
MDAVIDHLPVIGAIEERPTLSQQASRAMLQADVEQDLQRELPALQALDLHELRVRWRKLTRSTAPEHLTRALLLRLVAYKMQAKVYGDLDPETARYLARVARERVRRIKAGEKRKPKAPPPVPPVPSPAGIKPGTLIGREYQGVMHRVVVAQGGYEWKGQTYKSLSEIARQITGTRWNGPKFFGLRPSKTAARAVADGGGEA